MWYLWNTKSGAADEGLASDGSWVCAAFLVDTGAECTVCSASILAMLCLQPVVPGDRLSGLGGVVHSVIVETQIRLTREETGKVILRGEFAADTA